MTILLKLLYTDIRLKFLQPVHVATKASTNFYTRTPFFFLFSFLSKLKLSHIIIKQKSTDEDERWGGADDPTTRPIWNVFRH